MTIEDVAMLQLSQTKGLGNATLDRVLLRLSQEKRNLEDFVISPIEELIHQYGLRASVAESLKTTRKEAEQLAEDLDKQEIHILRKGTETYPKTLLKVLGNTAPPLLFARGNLGILHQLGVGFCGSRKTSSKGLKVAETCAGILTQQGLNVVSGYASGTDLASHCGAVKAGGTTTLVLAEGILNFQVKAALTPYLNDSNFVAISEFPPRLKWIARNAMQRNRTICGLSNAMILIESGLSGGTFAAGETTLELKLPLYVVEYADPPDSAEANRYFLERGAFPLRRHRDGRPNLDRLFQYLKS